MLDKCPTLTSRPDPAEIVARYRDALPAGRIEEFSTTDFDHTGIPAFAASIFVEDAQHSFGGQGYAMTDAGAQVGAYGELTEGLRSWLQIAHLPRRQASYSELVSERGPRGVQDPRTLGLPAGVDYDDHRPLQWLPMRRLSDGVQVLVPAEYVASEPYELTGSAPPAGWLTTPVTNGLGAHSDTESAVTHGVLEILQRDGNGLVFRALDRGVVLDVSSVTDPDCLAIMGRLSDAGITVQVKLAGTDFGITNLYVVGAGAEDDLVVATATGEAADPDPVTALRKALLEFAAARPRKALMHGPLPTVAKLAPAGYLERMLPGLDLAAEEPRVLESMVGWLTVNREQWRPWLDATIFSEHRRVPFTDLPGSQPALDLTGLADRLAAAGFEILVAGLDDSGPVAVPDGFAAVKAVKVLVPGLEVETVAYGRIGERNVRRLIELGRDDLIRIGDDRHRRDGDARVVLTAEAEERLGGPAWLNRVALDRAVGQLYPLYREPSRHAAPLSLQSR